ncbi:MAG: hypothetical protein AB1384_08530 [Actinomycetota bacterium]
MSVLLSPLQIGNLEIRNRFVHSATTESMAAENGEVMEVLEEVLEDGSADLISLSRPFIREPDLARRFEAGKEEASCTSCNGCFASMIASKPVRCFCRT